MITANQSEHKSDNFEPITNRSNNLIYMPRKSKQQNSPTRGHCDKERECHDENATQTPYTLTTHAIGTPQSTPDASTEMYLDALNFDLSKNFTKMLLDKRCHT